MPDADERRLALIFGFICGNQRQSAFYSPLEI